MASCAPSTANSYAILLPCTWEAFCPLPCERTCTTVRPSMFGKDSSTTSRCASRCRNCSSAAPCTT
eukprot:3841666-Pyramimonas_sp.AAC.1